MKKKRRALTRDMLLPLAVSKARALSLEYHLALSVLAAGNGGLTEASKLLQAVWHAEFMAESGDTDATTLDAAERALDAIGVRVDAGAAWTVTDAEHSAIARALAIHDRQTASVPLHRFVTAWERVQRNGRKLMDSLA